MRDNCEAVVLQHHDLSEEQEVEVALWNIHYRRIEDFRKHINDGNLVGDSVALHDARILVRLEQVKKIRSMFKIFLYEATGFYHDLMLKVKGKHGLPLVDTLDNQVILAKGAKDSAEMKKVLMSCYRCLIYLGDLARYKVLYGGEGKSNHDFTSASSYYAQAASLWPSIGTAHHQIGLLASYSGDYLVTIYGFFRSLAVDAPCPTARANSIVAFEKNRKTYTHSPPTDKEQELTVPEIFKALSSGFVRLIDILFTRTSLESFGEVSSLVISNMCNLLSSGPMEKLNFGRDAVENERVLLRLITILIFTVHDINDFVEQSSVEIAQHKVLLQNAFSFLFEFVGHILKRCTELNDVASSYLLPSIMVFMEWLACCPSIATQSDLEEKEAIARGYFWRQCISLMNKLRLSGFACIGGDDDTTCFSDMSLYNEGETDNRLALWEDFELREFIPLKTAQLILDFSRKHSVGNDGRNKEKKTRLKRIFASGKVLQAVNFDQKEVYYDSNKRKFVIGTKPSAYDVMETSPHGKSEIVQLNKENLDVTTERLNDVKQASQDGRSEIGQPKEENLEAKQQVAHLLGEEEDDEIILFQSAIAKSYPSSKAKQLVAHLLEEEEDDEIIVFQPTVAKKYLNLNAKQHVLEQEEDDEIILFEPAVAKSYQILNAKQLVVHLLEEDDEIIVFQPTVAKKYPNLNAKQHLLEQEQDDEIVLFEPAAAKKYPSLNAKQHLLEQEEDDEIVLFEPAAAKKYPSLNAKQYLLEQEEEDEIVLFEPAAKKYPSLNAKQHLLEQEEDDEIVLFEPVAAKKYPSLNAKEYLLEQEEDDEIVLFEPAAANNPSLNAEQHLLEQEEDDEIVIFKPAAAKNYTTPYWVPLDQFSQRMGAAPQLNVTPNWTNDVSDIKTATEQDIKEFVSFSGEIQYVEMQSESERSRLAYVTFKDSQGADTAILLSGATIVDLPVTITTVENYQLLPQAYKYISDNGLKLLPEVQRVQVTSGELADDNLPSTQNVPFSYEVEFSNMQPNLATSMAPRSMSNGQLQSRDKTPSVLQHRSPTLTTPMTRMNSAGYFSSSNFLCVDKSSAGNVVARDLSKEDGVAQGLDSVVFSVPVRYHSGSRNMPLREFNRSCSKVPLSDGQFQVGKNSRGPESFDFIGRTENSLP